VTPTGVALIEAAAHRRPVLLTIVARPVEHTSGTITLQLRGGTTVRVNVADIRSAEPAEMEARR
jgi:hypothetical protein